MLMCYYKSFQYDFMTMHIIEFMLVDQKLKMWEPRFNANNEFWQNRLLVFICNLKMFLT